jgi:alcohol dehydrogenase class IV
VRTGLIHTLAESLAPQVTLSHPETLWVFYASARASYQAHIDDLIADMDRALGGPGGMHRMDREWARAFEAHGLDANVDAALTAAKPDLGAIMANVMRDQVLLKENPAPIDWNAVRAVAAEALGPMRRAA